MSTNPTCLIVTPKIRELAAKFPNETVESVKNLVSLWQAKNNKSAEDIPMGYDLQKFIKELRKSDFPTFIANTVKNASSKGRTQQYGVAIDPKLKTNYAKWQSDNILNSQRNVIKESVYSKKLIKVLQTLIDKIKGSGIKEAKAAQNLYEWTIQAQQAILDDLEKGEKKDEDLSLDKVQEQLNNLIQKTPENLAKGAIKAAKEMGKDWGKNTEQKASRNYSNNESFTWDVTAKE